MGKKKGGKGRKTKKSSAAAAPAKAATGGNAAAAAKAKASPLELPPKEANLFKQVVKFYESKQYKKGLKAADVILKRFSEHGETLAMKGLILNYTGSKEEAHDYVRRGLKADMKSHVCWHVYGLLHRHERNYAQAARSYKQALRLDPQNQQILRDLSLLQIQLRLLDGFKETRFELLTIKSNQRTNWISFAISHQLMGNHATCLDVLDSYIGSVDEMTKPDYQGTYEDSELMLYYNDVLIETGRVADALTHLTGERKPLFKDHLRWRERRGELLVRLGKYDEALPVWRKLLRTNPENFEYHRHLQCCVLRDAEFGSIPLTTGDVAAGDQPARAVAPGRTVDPLLATGQRALGLRLPAAMMLDGAVGLTVEQLAALAATYDELNLEAPKANAHRRIPLDFAQGAQFEVRLERYLQRALQRASASVFSDVKHALRIGSAAQRRTKQRATIAIVERMVESLTGERGAFGGADAADAPREPPTSLLFARMLLGQLYDAAGLYSRALETFTAAIAHSPTCVELYMMKAKVLKHCGALTVAADVIDLGRKMDLADRFVNTKCSKYLLRDDRVTQAVDTIELFTKTEGEFQSTLFDMQCMWYELDRAESHERQGEWGPALKQFLAVESHMKDINEDQFDFHTYCIRKVTLRAYLQMIRLQDHLTAHPFYQRAMRGAVRIYLRLVDNPLPPLTPEEIAADEAEELKKKAAKAAAKKKKGKSAPKGEDEQAKKDEDEDPVGKKHLRVNALETAAKYSKLLLESPLASPKDRLQGQMLAYEVAMRKGKELLALQALKRGIAACGSIEHHEVHPRLVALLARVASLGATQSRHLEVVRRLEVLEQVFSAETAELGITQSAAEYALAYIARAEGDLERTLAGALALAKLDAAAHGAIASAKLLAATASIALESSADFCCDARAAQLSYCAAAHAFLSENSSDAAQLESHRALCHERFPLATLFASEAEKAAIYAEHFGAVRLLTKAEAEAEKGGAAATKE